MVTMKTFDRIMQEQAPAYRESESVVHRRKTLKKKTYLVSVTISRVRLCGELGVRSGFQIVSPEQGYMLINIECFCTLICQLQYFDHR